MRIRVEYAAWWLGLTMAYLGLVTSPTGWEIAAGLVVGAIVAAVAVLARRAFEPAFRAPSFVRRVVLLPVDVATDAVALSWLLLSGRALRTGCGELDRVTLPDDSSETRAWAVLLTSAAPGSLAVDVEQHGGRAVLSRHRLTTGSRSLAALEGR
jgi:multisubunit Na+/H+ antiporter MnhE subunit